MRQFPVILPPNEFVPIAVLIFPHNELPHRSLPMIEKKKTNMYSDQLLSKLLYHHFKNYLIRESIRGFREK